MNALVGIRANVTGLLSPTPSQRKDVAQLLASREPARVPKVSAAGTGSPQAIVAGQTVGQSEATSRDVTQELDRDAFLTLLILQLQNQNPLDPVDSTDMLAQLAQFTALEELNKLNDSFELLSGNIDQLNFISASSLLGRTVRGIDVTGNPREGVVLNVQLDGSIVVLNVDGNLMSMAGVLEILDAPAAEQEGEAE